MCDAGALRANRFVLGFEIPRLLNRSVQVSAVKRALCSGVYAHVTGHGLCVRLSLLDRLPFPARSPLEDMHYSFILGSRGLPMVPVASLDAAEVPGTVTVQVQQAARWFFGPARFTQYLNDPAGRPGWRARMMAASAFGSAAEWIGCASVPAVICTLIAVGSPAVHVAAACYAAGFLAPSARLLRSSPIPVWPGLVLYLDLPQEAVHSRNQGKFPPGSIYTDQEFNAAIRGHFRRLAGRKTPQVAWLDATLDLPELTRLAAARIRQTMRRQDIKGAV